MADDALAAFDAAASQHDALAAFDSVAAPAKAAPPRTVKVAPAEDGGVLDYVKAAGRGIAHAVGIPTSVDELKKAGKDAVLEVLSAGAVPAANAATDILRQGADAFQRAKSASSVARTAQAAVSGVPFVGAPAAAVAGPAITYAEGRAPTHQENVQAVEGGATLAVTAAGAKYASEHPVAEVAKVEPSAEFNPAEYVAQQAAQREAARVAPPTGSKASTFLKEAKTKLVDFASPIEDVLADSVKDNNLTLKPSEHITNQIDRVLRAPSLAGQFARDNGIEDVIKGAPDLEALDQYLIAKHASTVEANGIETGRDLAKDAQLVETLAPTYEPFAQKVKAYSEKLLDYATDSGLVAPELRDKLKAAYPDYVPLQRVFNELEKTDGGAAAKGVANLSSQTIVRRLSGSEREIESPIQSLLSKTNDAFIQGEKNKAARMLAGYEKLPGNPFQLQEVSDSVAGQAAGLGKPQGAHTFSFLEDGMKRTFSTTKEVADAAKMLDVERLNILGKVLAAPVRLARVGITGVNIPFIAANVAKDQITGAINSSHTLSTSIANPGVFMRSLFEAVHHGELFDEIVREAGMGTSFDIGREQIPKTVAAIRADRSLPTKIAYTVRHPSQLFRAVEDIVARGEELTRIQQYVGTKKALLAKGMPTEEARIAAAQAARENTVNFARRGEWGTVLNSAFLYLNAGIQGNRTLLRNLAQRPLATGAKIATTTFLPIAMATAWNMKDPARRAAYDDIATFEKENNIVIVPENPTKDAKGRWNVIKIPLSQEINNLSNVPRRSIEAAFGADPLRAGEIAKALVGTVSPITPDAKSILSTAIPQAVKPAAEVTYNKNFFTGREIVPHRLENRPPEQQVLDHTSGTARKIGEAAGVSPAKVETFVKETAGGVGSQALNAFDQALAAAGVIPPSQIGGEGIPEGVSRRFTKAFGGEKQRRGREWK